MLGPTKTGKPDAMKYIVFEVDANKYLTGRFRLDPEQPDIKPDEMLWTYSTPQELAAALWEGNVPMTEVVSAVVAECPSKRRIDRASLVVNVLAKTLGESVDVCVNALKEAGFSEPETTVAVMREFRQSVVSGAFRAAMEEIYGIEAGWKVK